MLSRPQEVQLDHISWPRLVSSSQVGDLKDNVCLGRTRLPEEPGHHIRQAYVHGGLHRTQVKGQRVMCLSKPSS